MIIKDQSYDDIDKVLESEKDLILKQIKKGDYIITLEIDGNMYNSVDLSKKIEEIQIYNPNITFIIGGSYGLHDDIKKLSDLKLSFSKFRYYLC